MGQKRLMQAHTLNHRQGVLYKGANTDSLNPADFTESGQPLDVLDFVDSRTVRAHWEKIGWNPPPIEASFIIWNSHKRTIAEKHAAWHNLIETTPDAIFPKHMLYLAGRSLHTFLEAYMRVQERLLDDLRSSEPGEACCWIVQKREVRYRYDAYVCPSFERAIRKLRDCIDEEDWGLDDDRFILTKRYFAGDSDEEDYDSDVSVLVSPDLEPIAFVDDRSPRLTQEEKDILWPGFEDMWFNFPLPFKRGDILVHHPSIYGDESRFVLDHDATLDPARDDDARILRLREEHGDYTDMLVYGHTVDEESGVVWFRSDFHDLLSLEPYDGELSGFERKLRPLSRFSRGKIDLKRCLQECGALDAQAREELEVERRKIQLEEVRCMYGTWSPELRDAMLPPELLDLLG